MELKIVMVVLQSGNTCSGQWILEKRNILEDYQSTFGTQATEIIWIGLMTDTDNTVGETTAYYGGIIFLDQ